MQGDRHAALLSAGLRKRRGSLLSKQGYSVAEVAERLGETKVVTAEHYYRSRWATTPRLITPPRSTAERTRMSRVTVRSYPRPARGQVFPAHRISLNPAGGICPYPPS
jgi:hypothetical protein